LFTGLKFAEIDSYTKLCLKTGLKRFWSQNVNHKSKYRP